MDIDNFSAGPCEACVQNETRTQICLSCMKIIYYEAIKDAIWCAFAGIDVEEAIKDGVSDNFNASDIEEVIRKAVSNSFPYPSEILTAIYNGTESALEKG